LPPPTPGRTIPAMIHGPRLLLLLPLAALLACGSSPSSPSTTPSPAPYDFNGTWDADSVNNLGAAAPFERLLGPLQVSNGVVTGTLAASTPYGTSNVCTALNTPLPVTGTLDTNNNLALTFPIAGGTGTLLATLANDPTTYAYGSWQVAGGTCAMTATYMAIKNTPTTPYTAPTSVPITANLSGNWAAFATYSFGSNYPVTGFWGALQFSNGSVTGTINLSYGANSLGGGCQHYNGTTAVVTGTLNSSNGLTLTFPVIGASSTGTATMTATLGSNPQTLADASFQIVGGGSCAMSATPSIIAQYAPVTGTYTGTFNAPNLPDNVPISGTTSTVTAVLTQSTTANSSGQFPIIGTVTVTGACTDTVTLTPGLVSGSGIWSSDSNNSDILIGPLFSGSSNPTASTIQWAVFNDATSNNSCNMGLPGYSGNLTHQ
jgi:hypothetical protein